ncbi:MAG: ADP-ribosylglycohydrolase family protein, partial [Lentisphaeria bacterium]|nr:ADP-ribosylglycohydrolase family protein [Lentisphaeria bacterium]
MKTASNWLKAPWFRISAGDLATERKQAEDEGRDLSALEAEFAALAKLDLDLPDNQTRAEALLDAVQEAPLVPSFAYDEPTDLAGIQAARPAATPLPACGLDEASLLDHALGAWQGRAAGCLLGKPVEGRRSWQIREYLESQGRWPLDRYFSSQVDPEVAKRCNMHLGHKALFEEGITCMVEDDDTNYTVTGLVVRERHGADFTPQDMARLWLSELPLLHVCTAERVAYRNFAASIPPPHSATYRNPYREWIGAQIRADFFGYANPGNPEKAADWAWRDASISHVKNGIYGEMWVAAMLAAAYVRDEVPAVLRAGLGQIPANCRLAAAIGRILELHADGATETAVFADIAARWNENTGHDWCHTISNAEIV